VTGSRKSTKSNECKSSMIDHSNDSKSSKRLDIIMEFKVYIDIEIATIAHLIVSFLIQGCARVSDRILIGRGSILLVCGLTFGRF
jgi:hypothetical protein